MQVHNHEDLVVWQRAMDLVLAVYNITSHFHMKSDLG